MNTSGIYIIKNKINGKFYVGSAVNIKNRWYNHVKTLKENIHKNRRLQNAWNKYGEQNFQFEILELVDDINDLINKEQYWIDILQACKNGYNLSPIAGSTLGVKFSEESKNKLRKLKSEEQKKKLSKIRIDSKLSKGNNNPMYVKTHTESSKEKMKYLKDGTSKSEAYKGENNHFYDKTHTEEVRKKISDSRKGKRSRTKLTIEQVKEIKNQFINKDKDITWNKLYDDLSFKYNVSSSGLRKIKDGSRWKDI